MDVLNDMFGWCIVTLLAALATLPVFGVVLVVTLVGGRWLAPWARHLLWSLVLVRLCLPFSFESSWSLQNVWNRRYEVQPLAASLSDPTTVNKEDELFRFEPLPASEEEPQWTAAAPQSIAPPLPTGNPIESIIVTVIPFVMLIGAAVMGLWTIVTSLRLRRWVASGTAWENDHCRALLNEGQRRFGIAGSIAVRIVPGLSGPATYGWWWPTILLPEDCESWSRVELRHVLWHELAHIRRGDVLWNWATAIVRMVHWWNPVFWFAHRAWIAERELACDALVLSQLEENGAREYGETLLKFIERMSTGPHDLPAAAPGFVSFWGGKRQARRRILQLAKLARPEPSWRKWGATLLVVGLGFAGLSDAASRIAPTPPPPLELPPGTTWTRSPLEDRNDGDQAERTYDLTAAIAKIRADDPELDSATAALSVSSLIHSSLPNIGAARPVDAAGREQGESLVVRATPTQHAEIQKLLALWAEHGQRQITFELRYLMTPLPLKDLLPADGGTVICAGSADLQTAATLGTNLLPNQATATSTVPLYRHIISDSDLGGIVRTTQGDARSNIIMAPKVTVMEGMPGTVLMGSQRPFVTGVHIGEEKVREPLISLVTEGTTLSIRAMLSDDGETTRLTFGWQDSRVEKVALGQLTNETAVQIPHVSRSEIQVIDEIPPGHTLLIAPLEHNDAGQVRLLLVTPRRVR